MLVPAVKYKDQIENLQYDIWFNDKYKYWNADVYYARIDIDETTWDRHQFVSVHNDNVIGFISYDISRSDNTVHNLNIINFSDNKTIFGLDVRRAIIDIFEKFKFRKLLFHCIVGNPIESTYDKLVDKYGGRIVGIYKKDVKLIDGEYYDKKQYEILAEDYFKVIEDNKNKEIILPSDYKNQHSIEVHRCGSEWCYCDGNCEDCYASPTNTNTFF